MHEIRFDIYDTGRETYSYMYSANMWGCLSRRASVGISSINLPPLLHPVPHRVAGIGLAPEHMAEVFEPFIQVEASFGGNGLGLALARKSAHSPSS